MGYRGKVEAQGAARDLRAQGRTLANIAAELSVSKSSVSLWVRDIEVPPQPRRQSQRLRAHPQHIAKLKEIEECNRVGIARIGTLGDDAFLAAGAALYAGEGSKTGNKVVFANSDPAMMRFFCRWLRRFFEVDEERLRARIYLHQGLDLDAATRAWSEVMGIPRGQFHAPYRAVADPTIRRNKHEFGCAYLQYCCARTHRQILGLARALLACGAVPG